MANIPITKSIFNCYNSVLSKSKISSSKSITELEAFTHKQAAQVRKKGHDRNENLYKNSFIAVTSFLRIWLHLLKKFLMQKSIFCAVCLS